MALSMSASLLARTVTSEDAQRSFLTTHPDASETLAGNRRLAADVWRKLLHKAKAPVAAELAARVLDEQQLAELVKDKRVTVRTAIVSKGLTACTDTMVDTLLAQEWFDDGYATIWLTAKTVPAHRHKEVLTISNGPLLIAALADSDMFTDAEAIELLLKARKVYGRTAIWGLLDHRPALIEAIMASGTEQTELLEAVAGSRHVFDTSVFESLYATCERRGMNSSVGSELWLTLVLNPNTPRALFDKMIEAVPHRQSNIWTRFRPHSNAELLSNRRKRARTHQGLGSVTFAWETGEGEWRDMLVDAVRDLGINRFPTLREWYGITPPPLAERSVPTPSEPLPADELRAIRFGERLGAGDHREMNRLVNDELDAIGIRAWETFWSLTDDWQGTWGELIDSSIELSA